jgi:hypothetical protein
MNYKGLKKDMDEVVKLFSLIKWACASWHSSRAITFVQHGMVLLILLDMMILDPGTFFMQQVAHTTCPCHGTRHLV